MDKQKGEQRMNKFQKTYLFLFIFSLFGMVGNIELGVEIPTIWKVIMLVTGFLTIGKIIYLSQKGVI